MQREYILLHWNNSFLTLLRFLSNRLLIEKSMLSHKVLYLLLSSGGSHLFCRWFWSRRNMNLFSGLLFIITIVNVRREFIRNNFSFFSVRLGLRLQFLTWILKLRCFSWSRIIVSFLATSWTHSTLIFGPCVF